MAFQKLQEPGTFRNGYLVEVCFDTIDRSWWYFCSTSSNDPNKSGDTLLKGGFSSCAEAWKALQKLLSKLIDAEMEVSENASDRANIELNPRLESSRI